VSAFAAAGVGRTPVSDAEPMAAAVDAAVAATVGSGNVSLKDIARTAAREAERELILRMLTRTRWNRKEAAEILGISYKALLYKIKENGLDKAS
jgi:two-component system response regulator AtoC